MSQKTAYGESLNRAARQKALDHIHLTGKNLPATVKKVKGSIIQVAFEVAGGYTLPNVTIPHFGPEWIRYPTQEGDKGVVISVDSIIGHMTGLGSSKAPGLSRPGNLSPLIFLPIGNADWSKVDKDKITAYGKNGGVLRDKEARSVVSTDGPQKTAGFAHGKPSSFDEENIDPSQYDHHSIATDDGLKHKTSKTHAVEAKESTVDAQEKHTITAPQTDVNGNARVSQNLTVAATLQAALAAIGGIGGIGGGAVPGNLQMAGNVTAGGNLQGDLVFTQGFLVADLPDPTGLVGARAHVIDALSPSWRATLVGGGSEICPAFCTGADWIAA